MTDPRIIVAIDTYDLQEANVILDQLDPDLCRIKSMPSIIISSSKDGNFLDKWIAKSDLLKFCTCFFIFSLKNI